MTSCEKPLGEQAAPVRLRSIDGTKQASRLGVCKFSWKATPFGSPPSSRALLPADTCVSWRTFLTLLAKSILYNWNNFDHYLIDDPHVVQVNCYEGKYIYALYQKERARASWSG